LDGTEPILNRLSECTHLEELIFSNVWWNDNKEVKSKNQGQPNHLQQFPQHLPAQLKKLIAGGWGKRWSIRSLAPIQTLTDLAYLELRINQLSQAPDLANLTQLTHLSLSNNQLSQAPDLANLTQLKELDLSHNQLSKAPDLAKLTQLKELDLSHNQLSEAPDLASLTRLISLDLSHNQLSEAPDLANLTQLAHLHLSNNQLSKAPDLTNLTRLISLDLSHNQLSEAPNLVNLTQLIYLDLVHNLIPEITLLWLNQLPSLKILYLYDNPIQNIPAEVYNKQGKNVLKAIRDYLESIAVGSKPLNEAKLLLVGVGEVGKTELVKAISQPDYAFVAGQNSTQGIDITRWQLPQPPASVPDFTANIWDFAGQEVNYGTHQFFLTKNSVYVFVWDTRKGEAQSKFLYWLKVVTLLSKGAPIFVVQNKIDEYDSEIDQRSWKESFPNIVGFMKTSCKVGTGLAELRQAVAKQLCALPHIGDLWNPKRLKIRQTIERHPYNYLNRHAYLQICATHQLDTSQAGFLSQQLHDLGVVLHYQEDPLLRDTVVLKPQWAIDAAYCVLNNKSIVQGKFELDDLDHIWADACYDHKHPFLLRLMERFELIFKLANQHTYIVPELLPHEPSAKQKTLMPSAKNAPRELFFEYQYDFMPEGIMTHFICRSHELIHQELFWKYGVVLRHQQSFALVLHNSAESFIRVHCWGATADKLLFLIRNHFDHIHQRLNRPEVAEVIPCPCDKCAAVPRNKKEFFEESYLRMCLEEGDTDVRCSNRTKVSIQQLLEGIINESSTLQRRLLHLINTYQVDEFFVELKRQKIDNDQLASLRKRFIHDGGGFQFADQLKVWVLDSVRF
jgi:GTPase SAR1 family protein